MSPIQRLHEELARLPEVTEGVTRFGDQDRAAWFVGGREFAHLHSNDIIDLRLPRSIQRTLRDDPRAHFRAGPSEWLELEFHTMRDVADVASLAHQACIASKRQRRRRI